MFYFGLGCFVAGWVLAGWLEHNHIAIGWDALILVASLLVMAAVHDRLVRRPTRRDREQTGQREHSPPETPPGNCHPSNANRSRRLT